MDAKQVFDERVPEYEEWFDRNRFAYLSELELVRKMLPPKGRGIEIGVGTGRFAAPLGVEYGIDISEKMLKIAEERGVKTVKASAEQIPFDDNSFDFALLIVTICFLNNPLKALSEIRRILKDNGELLIGIVDKDSALGKFYLKKKEKSPFYKYAQFFSAQDIISLTEKSGFSFEKAMQTLFVEDLNGIDSLHEVREGFGEGGFVVIKARKI